MEKTYDQDLQRRLEGYITASGISQAKLAPKIGISQTALSQYRRSMYDKGDIAALESKLAEFLRIEESAQQQAAKAAPYLPVLEYIPTSISEDVYKAIEYCQIERGMVILHGDAGIGKTKGAEKFIKDHPSAAIYVQATPASGTLGNMLKLLARALKVPESRNKLELILAIRERLEGTNKVIIIDEAQHLKLNALEEIRTLSDPNSLTGQRGTGICLIGNTQVYTRMLGKQEAQFAQLFSRIRMNCRYSTKKITTKDVAALFPRLAEDGAKKELGLLHSVCQSKWGVRGAVNLYNNAVNNSDISYDGLYGMVRKMGIGLV